MDQALSPDAVKSLKRWFVQYVRSFQSGEPDWNKNITLKKVHTFRVCRESKDIARDIGLSPDDVRLADVIALFHDVGRFEQYARYQTYVDRRSVDHAELGVDVLRKTGALDPLDESLRELILRVILYHNRPRLPENETDRCLLFTKVLRDADKLDVLRVATGLYLQDDPKSVDVVVPDLPDTPGVSDQVCADLMRGKIVEIANLKNLNDFKLLQMGWIYDVNFSLTLRRIRDRGFLDRIRSVLPDSERIDRVFAVAQRRIEERIAADEV